MCVLCKISHIRSEWHDCHSDDRREKEFPANSIVILNGMQWSEESPPTGNKRFLADRFGMTFGYHARDNENLGNLFAFTGGDMDVFL